MKVEIRYFVEDVFSFKEKILPYIFGGGVYFKYIKVEPMFEKNSASLVIEANTLSQLITVSTGMLRYSPDCILEKVEIIETNKVISKNFSKQKVERAILGVIIKPSLSFDSQIAKQLIKESVKYKVDFIKDDDASEYSKQEAAEILKLAGDVPYLQKIVEPEHLVSKFSMVVPWVDGWKLLQEMSKKSISSSHCATLSQQVSWYSHIIFSRFAGASFVIVPDPAFDEKFNLKTALEAASKQIYGVNSTRLIISGGINPSRINNLLKEIDRKHHKYVGFAVGSWVLSNSNKMSENIESLKKAIMK